MTYRMFSSFLLCHILSIIGQSLCYEPTETDLICFNNYETEMKCSLPSENLISCSGYRLNITHEMFTVKTYTCNFERSHHDASCECKIIVDGFVLTEKFSIALLKETKVLLRKQLTTMDFIKPKTPVLKVQKTENGNLKVTWDDQYVEKTQYFPRELEINLIYGIKGGHETMSKMLLNTVGFYEIVASNLQPSTEYFLTANMGTKYNNKKILSDEKTVYFTTAASPNQIVKIVVPLLCGALFFIICTIFICILRMKKNWWDKIAKPKIDASFGEDKGHILPTPEPKFSTMRVEIPKLDLQEKKELISSLYVDTNTERSSPRIGSVSADYGQAGAFSGQKEINDPINFQLRVKQAMEEDFKLLLFTNNTPISPNTKMPYSSVDTPSREHSRANRDSGNCSGSSVFSNMSYLESTTECSSFLEQLSCDQSDKTKVSNFPTNVALEDGYKSFNTVLNKGSDMNVCGNLSSDLAADDKFIMKNLITSSNPLYPPTLDHDGTLTSDDGYKAVQDLSKSTEGQWSFTTERKLTECGALKPLHSTGQEPTLQPSSWASTLNFSTPIQIDNSYHAV